MKKTLEDELMSLAHRILKLRGREDLEELREAAGELYDKLTILSFAEKHFAGPQPTIGKASVLEALKKDKEQHDIVTEEKKAVNSTPEPDKKEEQPKEELISEPADLKDTEEKTEEIKEPVEEVATPQPEEPKEPVVEEIPKKEEEIQPFAAQESEKTPAAKKEEIQPVAEEKSEESPKSEKETVSTPISRPEDIDFREIAVHYDDLPQFDPVQTPIKEYRKEIPVSEPKETEKTESYRSSAFEKPAVSQNPNLFSSMDTPKTRNNPRFHKKSINESLNLGMNIGLNDRHAFIKNLFEGNSTDFQRVISQLSTFENYEEAKSFIEEQVKPDYDWENKTEYEERFFTTIEKKMSH